MFLSYNISVQYILIPNCNYFYSKEAKANKGFQGGEGVKSTEVIVFTPPPIPLASKKVYMSTTVRLCGH